MVKVQIPLNTPVEEEEESENEVGVMSDSEESDVDDDIGDPDWEEVKSDGEKDNFSFKPGIMPTLPENGITINLGRPQRKRGRVKLGNDENDDQDEDSDIGEDFVAKKKKKREIDLNEMVRKSINRVKITDQIMKHKLSLLLYLARGLRLVKIINCNIIRGLSLSIADSRFRMKPKIKNRKFLENFIAQFNDVVAVTSDDDIRSKHMQQPFMLNLLECYSTLTASSLIELTVMFVACLKALKPDLPVRIVNVLRPITLRADIIPKPNSKSTSKGGSPDQPITLGDTPDPPSPEYVEKLDFWVEVYLNDEEKWCCVDLCNLKLDEPNVLTELSRPFCYLVSYDVDRYCIKPAEKNYCEDWYTPSFRRGRCEDKWWDMVMAALGPTKENEKDLADENKTEEVMTKQDMPTSESAFKNHPLYVLQKHLLKYQAIYPPEVPPMSFFKDQPVYPRDCVQTLRSRETWIRHARTVMIGQTPYKVVKAHPKRDKYTGELIRDRPLELFGEWQTRDYEPPTAEDGKVPRNAYGNVDMYQPCMLPHKCVWLKLPGLQRVANKLGIDVAQAVVGFDNHCGSYGAHPVMDGFIVCEEHAETLQMAWEEDQQNARKREEEKRQKRIWDNWKRLLKAAMIREKLRVKYKNS